MKRKHAGVTSRVQFAGAAPPRPLQELARARSTHSCATLPTAGAHTYPLHPSLCSLPGYNKVHSILTNVSEELPDVPLYFNLHDM